MKSTSMKIFSTYIMFFFIHSVGFSQDFNFVRNNPFGSFQYVISDITQGPNDTIWVCNVGGEYAKKVTSNGWEATSVPGHFDTDFNFILLPTLGEMWISSSNNGLLKFIDEELVEHYTAANSDLPNDVIKGISYDSDNGILWIATEGGLASLQGDMWNVYTDQNSDLESNDITALAVADDGTVWIGADKMYSFSSGNWQSYPQSETGLGSTIYDLTVGTNNLWIAHAGGVSSFDGAAWEKARSGRANQVVEDKKGRVWSDLLGTGLGIYNGEGNFLFNRDLSTDDFIGSFFENLFVDSDNHVWTTSDVAGLFEVTGVPYTTQADVVKPITCFGDNDATLNVNILEGTAPFTYQWNPDNIQGKSPTDLPPGDYSVTVVDAEGNVNSSTVTIIDPTIQIITFFGDSTGTSASISVLPTGGGRPPFSYEWSDGSTERNRNNLPSGYYDLTVTDANGCEEVFTIAFGENSSTDNRFFESNFTVQPTVSTGIFNLIQKEFSTHSQIGVNIFDLYGQKVFTKQSNNENTKMDLTSQSPGIYFLKLDLGSQIFTKKIMVIK